MLKTADPAKAQRHFTDLSLLATLVSAAWPHRPGLTAPTRLLDAFSTHHDEQNKLLKSREPQIKGPPRLDTSWRIIPQAAPATAALLAMVRQFLRLPALDRRERLTELMDQAPAHDHPRWGGTWGVSALKSCSPPLRQELQVYLARQEAQAER